MDKRHLSAMFRDRLKHLLAAETKNLAGFLRETGIDRSALSQFLDPSIDRLPRAETLRRISEARGVSVDWLLGLDNAPEGRQSISSSFQIETAKDAATSPLHDWHKQADGRKLRYVPSTLPDMMQLGSDTVETPDDSGIRGTGVENVLDGIEPTEMDIEIAMPVQTLRDLAAQTGLWRGACPAQCKRQLQHMADLCDEKFPALRLHLYDGTSAFSAPFTVFGKQRVALYIGEAYLVLTGRAEIEAFVQRFDALVRIALIGPDQSGKALARLAASGEWTS
ncbi:MAG: helix-turn-helix transcriptional regulator [Roseovarius sp.]|nr:helix-turn-helix transcriptional regulator [Roseovarius sp.]